MQEEIIIGLKNWGFLWREKEREESHGKDEWKRQTISYASDSDSK